MKTFCRALLLPLALYAGHIANDTTWGPGTVDVTDTVFVDSGVTLTIAPGTRVDFQGRFALNVRGRVLAQGLPADTIAFTASDTAAGWGGIRFSGVSATDDTSRFSFCRIEYARNSGTGTAAWGAGFFLQTPARARIDRCLIRRNSGQSYGGGIYVSSSGVALLDNVIRENQASAGAGICVYGGTPLISDNLVTGNTAASTGGGIFCAYASPRLVNNVITQNSAGNGGGFICTNAPVTLINCLICGNNASMQGGGGFCPDSLLRLINCTVVNNRAVLGSGGLYSSTTNTAASPVLVNTLFWGNFANGVFNQLSLNNPTVKPDIRHCDIQGGTGAFTGNGVPRVYRGNFDLDPLFADSAAGDFSLAAGSPCVNAGAPDTSGLGLPALDLAGSPRVYGGAAGRVDAGAYEAQADPAGTITVTAPAGGDLLTMGGVFAITWTGAGTVGDVRIEFSADSGRTWQAIVASTPNSGSFSWAVPATISAGCVVRVSRASTGAPFDESDGLFAIHDPTRLCGWITRDTVLDADTIKVGCPIYVDTGVTLTISPGTRVEFLGPFPLKVRGRLLALGLVTDSILFTARDTSVGWRGIRFDSLSAASDTSRIAFCRIQYARASGTTLNGYGGGIYINGFSKVVVAHSTIRNNTAVNGGAGVCAWLASPVIRNNTIRNNRTTDGTFSFGAGIFCQSSSPLIEGNLISHNASSREGGGIALQGGSPRVVNTRIEFNTAGNEGGGIRCIQGGSPIITGCLIRGNTAYDGGGAFANGSNLIFRNSTVANNRASIGPGLKLETSSAQVRNSILWNNGISTSGSAVSGEYSCLPAGYTGNGTISTDPMFLDSGAGDFSLSDRSPCVNTGNPDTAGLSLPEFDMEGNLRVFDGRVDMGAYESRVPLGIETALPAELTLAQNFPNPFNPMTSIRYDTGPDSKAELAIFNLNGQRLLSRIVNGRGSLVWDAGNRPSGLYLCRLTAGTRIQEMAMVLLK